MPGYPARVVPYEGHGPKGTLTEQEARKLLEEQSHSGLSFHDYARSMGLSPQRLLWWKNKFSRLGSTASPISPQDQTPTFVPVLIEPHQTSAPPLGTSMAMSPPKSAFELVFADGRSLLIPQDFEATSLSKVLTVLSEVS